VTGVTEGVFPDIARVTPRPDSGTRVILDAKWFAKTTESLRKQSFATYRARRAELKRALDACPKNDFRRREERRRLKSEFESVTHLEIGMSFQSQAMSLHLTNGAERSGDVHSGVALSSPEFSLPQVDFDVALLSRVAAAAAAAGKRCDWQVMDDRTPFVARAGVPGGVEFTGLIMALAVD
jgi:hypothetical protein